MKIFLILFCTYFGSAIEAGTDIHPFHVTNTEINYNAIDKNLEVSCKIFVDDFESALEKTFKQKADFSDKALEGQMEKLVRQYMKEHLAVSVDKKPLTLNYLGYETDREAVNIYLESSYNVRPKSFLIQNTLNYEVYDDQVSIIHVIVDGKRNTKKVIYPEKSETFNF